MPTNNKELREFTERASVIALRHNVPVQQAIDALLDPPPYVEETWQSRDRVTDITRLRKATLLTGTACSRHESHIGMWLANAAKIRPPGTYTTANSGKEESVSTDTQQVVKVRTRARSKKCPPGDDSNMHSAHVTDLNYWCYHCWVAAGRPANPKSGPTFDPGDDTDPYGWFEWSKNPTRYKPPKPLGKDWKFPFQRTPGDNRDYDAECGVFDEKESRGLYHSAPRIVLSHADSVTKEKESAMKTTNRSLVSTAGTFVAKLRKGSGLSATAATEGAKLAAKLTGAKMAMTIAHKGVVKLVEKSPLPLMYKGPALWALNTDPGVAAVGITMGAILPFAQPFLPAKYQSVCAEASFVLSTRSQQFVYETWGDAAVGWLSSMLDEMAPALGVSVISGEQALNELEAPAVTGEVVPKTQKKAPVKAR